LSLKQGDDGRTLLNCHANCSIDSICAAMGITKRDLFPENRNGRHGAQIPKSSEFQTVATYDYCDEHGELRFQAVRQHAEDLSKPCGYRKTFRQRRPDANGGWICEPGCMDGVERILYRLPEIIRDVARGLPIFIVEGEKDCEAMVKRGFSATCNVGGAGKWMDGYSETLRGADVIVIPDKDEPGRKHAEQVADALAGIAKRVRIIELPDLNGKKVKDAHDFFSAGGTAEELIGIVDSQKTLAERIRDRRFNVHIKPAPVVPRYFVNGIPICTPGNFTAISAMPKGGKSAFVSAMAASVMALDNRDCLGVTSSNPNGHAVIKIDTEQSIEDHDALDRRTLARAGLSEPPKWYYSYCLTGFPIADARAAVQIMLAEAARECGGIHSATIDGVADMVFDVNDPGEAGSVATEWQGLGIKYHCPIIGVIHLNPGTEKTRGHLGSQLERKAETNLRLEKDGDAVIVWADKNRRAPISKTHGPRFAWSEELQMHVSVESQASAKEKAERESLVELAEIVFEDRPSLRHKDLVELIARRGQKSPETAKRRLTLMLRLGVIKKSFAGLYTLESVKQAYL
jgi:5S rRNA maturation endonuclease (ribonuclease M5)